jgi:sugar phosphate isomerase/epimerase
MRRREFIRTVSRSAALIGSLRIGQVIRAAEDPSSKPAVPLDQRICLFTDHLDDHGYRFADVAKMLSQLGISGPDLTVRPGGLVAPERVADELPKAAAAFRDVGLSIPMISTNVTSREDQAAVATLRTMSQLGIRFYKLGYYHYHDLSKWQEELDVQRKKLAGLLELGRELNLHAGVHNHAGVTIGGALWDGWEFLQGLDPTLVGFYFDPAHATIEGAVNAWKLNLLRIAPRLTMVALKDFVWEKGSAGWRTRWCPLGEGLVKWSEFFPLLSRIPFPGPISIHIEYDPGGKTRSERIDNSLAAAQRDIQFVRQHLQRVRGAK